MRMLGAVAAVLLLATTATSQVVYDPADAAAGRQPQDPTATCDSTAQSSCACEASFCCSFDGGAMDYRCTDQCASNTLPPCDPCEAEAAASCTAPVMDLGEVLSGGGACWDIINTLNPRCSPAPGSNAGSCRVEQT